MPEAVTEKVAVVPAVTVVLAGWVAMLGATGVPTPEIWKKKGSREVDTTVVPFVPRSWWVDQFTPR